MHSPIKKCRLCANSTFIEIVDLGIHSYTGLFLKDTNSTVPSGRLSLIKCTNCDLLQLKDSFDLNLLYGNEYGYRSGLNATMVRHLQQKVVQLVNSYGLSQNDFVLDIGSNDGTTLNYFSEYSSNLVGFDPSAHKFKNYYKENIAVEFDFFDAKTYLSRYKPAKLVTSIAMFYDLEDPVDFAKQIKQCLTHDGVWHFEQAYSLSMLNDLTFDTICHEHLEYYNIDNVIDILALADLKIINIELNSINGGSFSIDATHKDNSEYTPKDSVDFLLSTERDQLKGNSEILLNFAKRIMDFRSNFKNLILNLKKDGNQIWGLGASTKGNVLLQFCGLDYNIVSSIAEINQDKWNKFTPGTKIPIVDEIEWISSNPEYTIVLPWHFKENFIERYRNYLENGGTLIFPLPVITLVNKDNLEGKS